MGDKDKSFRERVSDMFYLNQDEQPKGNENQQWSKETKVDNDIKSTTTFNKEDDHVRRFENPSYLHGVQDSEGLGKIVGHEELKETGMQQQLRGNHERINAAIKDDDKYNETYLMDY
nr:1457_t:CDS:2 [Entrophospora candida]